MIRFFLQDKCLIKLRGCRPFDDCLATRISKLRVLEMLRIAATEDARKNGSEANQIFINRPAHSKTQHVRVYVAMRAENGHDAGRHCSLLNRVRPDAALL